MKQTRKAKTACESCGVIGRHRRHRLGGGANVPRCIVCAVRATQKFGRIGHEGALTKSELQKRRGNKPGSLEKSRRKAKCNDKMDFGIERRPDDSEPLRGGAANFLPELRASIRLDQASRNEVCNTRGGGEVCERQFSSVVQAGGIRAGGV